MISTPRPTVVEPVKLQATVAAIIEVVGAAMSGTRRGARLVYNANRQHPLDRHDFHGLGATLQAFCSFCYVSKGARLDQGSH